ncbi:MAG: hypothetical protein Q9195_008784 [Heterodermia aff. obscurata]
MPDSPPSSGDTRTSPSDPPPAAANTPISDYYRSLSLHSICTRVLESGPESITPQERAFLQLRPDPSIEDSLYLAKTSLTRRALVQKALASEPTPTEEPHLTKAEAGALAWGVQDLSAAEQTSRLKSKSRLSEAERDLLKRARAALRTEEDKEYEQAGRIAFKVWQGYTAAERQQAQERDTASGKDPAVSFQERVVLPWERANWMTLLQEKGYQSWGLPVLRTEYGDPAAWLNFKTRFTALAREEVGRISAPLAEGLRVLYMEDEDALAGAEQAGLVAYYARARAEGKVPESQHLGVFISYDAGVQDRWANSDMETLAPVWYSDWDADKVDRFGFRGALAMRPEMIWRTLVPKLVRGDVKPLEGLHMMAEER